MIQSFSSPAAAIFPLRVGLGLRDLGLGTRFVFLSLILFPLPFRFVVIARAVDVFGPRRFSNHVVDAMGRFLFGFFQNFLCPTNLDSAPARACA